MARLSEPQKHQGMTVVGMHPWLGIPSRLKYFTVLCVYYVHCVLHAEDSNPPTYSMAWHDRAQRGSVMYIVAWHNAHNTLLLGTYSFDVPCPALPSTAQHSTAQHSTAQQSIAQQSRAQHSTAQHNTTQRNAAPWYGKAWGNLTTQHSTAQHSITQHSSMCDHICMVCYDELLRICTELKRNAARRKLSMDRVGVTNGVVRGLSELQSLEELLLPNSYRATDAGLAFFSQLTNLR